MTEGLDPIPGNWYHMTEKEQKFRVVGVDEDARTVEVQYFDGAVDEFDLSRCYALGIETIEPPADWTGPADNIRRDNLDDSATDMQREDWEGAYDEAAEKERAGPRRRTKR